IQDISAIAATSLVINMLRQVEAKISAMNIPSESLSGRRQDLIRLSENLTNQVKAAYELTRSQVGNSSDVISAWDDRRLKRKAFMESLRGTGN
ncbi:conjugal transfer protein, partial [Escherichia coli]